MRTGRPALALILTVEERQQLEALCRRAEEPQAEVNRARAILTGADGPRYSARSACARILWGGYANAFTKPGCAEFSTFAAAALPAPSVMNRWPK